MSETKDHTCLHCEIALAISAWQPPDGGPRRAPDILRALAEVAAVIIHASPDPDIKAKAYDFFVDQLDEYVDAGPIEVPTIQ